MSRGVATALAAFALAGSVRGNAVSEEFSFRPPFNDINPFTGGRQINNFDLGGTAEAHRSFVRLTAESQGSKGWLMSQQPLYLCPKRSRYICDIAQAEQHSMTQQSSQQPLLMLLRTVLSVFHILLGNPWWLILHCRG